MSNDIHNCETIHDILIIAIRNRDFKIVHTHNDDPNIPEGHVKYTYIAEGAFYPNDDMDTETDGLVFEIEPDYHEDETLITVLVPIDSPYYSD